MAVTLKVLRSVEGAFVDHTVDWGQCVKCRIGTLAKQHVFARGVLPCDVLFLGEAPGPTEDMTGVPFSGRAGKVFAQFVTHLNQGWFMSLPGHKQLKMAFDGLRGVGGEALRWAVTNTVLCQPVDESGGPFRAPSPEEKTNCCPRLDEFIATIAKPKAIICLGRQASDAAPFWEIKTSTGIPFVEIRHPSYIARKGGLDSVLGGEIYREDLAKALAFLIGRI